MGKYVVTILQLGTMFINCILKFNFWPEIITGTGFANIL
jgi:hypothetical protein